MPAESNDGSTGKVVIYMKVKNTLATDEFYHYGWVLNLWLKDVLN